MKTKIFLLTLLLMVSFWVLADDSYTTPINLSHTHQGGPRDGYPMYDDMPQAFHNFKSHEIIIDGDGVVSYYNVEISTPGTNTVEISTQVDGTYDTFSISSLPSGTHVITLTSPSGNVFEGTI